MPVVSDRPDSSAPAATQARASAITSSSGTRPCSVQPKAVEMPASIRACGAISSRSAAMARTSSTICMGVLRTLAMECAGLADTGRVTLWTPARSAASAPRRLGTRAITVTPGSVMAWATTSAASAIWGSSLGETKEPTSISCRPAWARVSIHASLCAVDMVEATDCRPSRGPTSLMSTSKRWEDMGRDIRWWVAMTAGFAC